MKEWLPTEFHRPAERNSLGSSEVFSSLIMVGFVDPYWDPVFRTLYVSHTHKKSLNESKFNYWGCKMYWLTHMFHSLSGECLSTRRNLWATHLRAGTASSAFMSARELQAQSRADKYTFPMRDSGVTHHSFLPHKHPTRTRLQERRLHDNC